MYKLIVNSAMPRWLKWLLYVLLTITCVYWIGYLIYKILELFRKFIHWVSDKRNYWTFLMCVFILLIGSLLISQFALGLNPFEHFADWFIEKITDCRRFIGGLIGGGN